MPDLELAASDVADLRRSRPQGRTTLDLLRGADDLGFSAHSADSPNPHPDNGRDAGRG